MQFHRTGEHGAVPPRSDRFFALEDSWYFSTREGAPIGPFDNRVEAEQGLLDFIEFIQIAAPNILSKLYAALSS